jgi:hypothetical protein
MSTHQPYGIRLSPPSPRSLQELVTERTYLLNSLETENYKATELLRRISPLEDIWSSTPINSVRRKTKKQLGWLKQRLGETIGQEEAVLARLGQVALGIQAQERWTWVEEERRREQMMVGMRMQAMGTRLNAEVPEFRPGLEYAMPETPEFSLSQVPRPQQCQPPSPSYFALSQQPSIHSYVSERSFSPQIQPAFPPFVPSNSPEIASIPQIQLSIPSNLPGLPCVPPLTSEPVTNASSRRNRSRNTKAAAIKANAERPFLLHRSSSMSSVELDILSTKSNTPDKYVTTQKNKRNSMPSIPGGANIWTPTTPEKQEMAVEKAKGKV